MLTTAAFLKTVVTATEPGYFCLALRKGGVWLEEWHKWPEQLDTIVERAEAQKDIADVYFSTYLFKAPQSTRSNVIPTRTIQADLDDADVSALSHEPTVLVETSPGRHHAYWVLDQTLPLEEHEALSRKITYSIPLCDRSGWPLGRKLRIPNTLNHKYFSGAKTVKVLAASNKKYEPEQFEALSEVPQFVVEHFDPNFLENPVGVATNPLELLDQIKSDIPVKVYVQYSNKQEDRSEALWALLCWGFKAGLNREQVFTLAKHSANNKFADLKHRADQDLAKDVLRAEFAVNTNTHDAKQVIQGLYKTGLSAIERKRAIFNVVLKSMKDQGEFFNAQGGLGWYIRSDVGRPIALTPHSELLQTLLNVQFGLNFTEPEARYVAYDLKAHAANLPENAIQGALSHYDTDAKHILLHTGRRTVLRITADSVEQIVDGAYNVIFPWSSSVDPFTPSYRSGENAIDWGEELFGNGTRGFGSSVENVTNMTPSQARALLKVWLIFVLMRDVANTRPIIATFGQPGSGKSTLFKKVYALLYGQRKSISSVTNVDDFDHATASDPLVVFDNVDTWEKWLPDRLALSAGKSDVVRRKLYTDTDTITLRRQAIIGVTAHNPKFGREDVADRFLLFSYKRLDHFISEALIINDILKKRNLIWGAIVRDVQQVLRSPLPTTGIPQFRIEDFARIGLWIAQALGVDQDFREAVEDVKSAQQAYVREEEGLLVQAIMNYIGKSSKENKPPQHHTASQLWTMLEGCASDGKVFANMYRNSVLLSKKISAMQPALREVIRIEQGYNEGGTRTWLLAKKEDTANGID